MSKDRKPNYKSAIKIVTLIRLLSKDLRYQPLGEILDKLEISEKTLKRYLKVLNEEFTYQDGIPFIDKTKDGEVTKLKLNYKDFVETNSFIIASLYTGRALFRKMGDTIFNSGMEHAFVTFKENSLDDSERNKLLDLDRKIISTEIALKDYSDNKKNIEDIIESLINNKRIQIKYRSLYSKKEKILIIHPYTLLLHKESIYLNAYCESFNDIRKFALEGIKEIIKTNEIFKYPAKNKYDPNESFEYSFGIYDDRENDPIKISVCFDIELEQYIKSRKWHKTQNFSENGKDSFIMNLTLSNTLEFFPWILQFGSKVRVIEPEDLKQRVKSELIKSLEKY